MRIGYFLASEEFGPLELVRQAALAEQAGFDGLWISDHFHPWTDEQGHSGFVWATIGALSQATTRMRVMTAVTCPTVRTHPAIVAQAAATAAVLLEGRFSLGLGSGEALNEHILGDHWPEADERLAMLEEAIEIIRTLWRGETYSHRGDHYLVENARIYDLPQRLPEILISGFGSKSLALAARLGDGFCTVQPDGDAVAAFRAHGGEGKRVTGGLKLCWGDDEARARATAHRLWRTDVLPGSLRSCSRPPLTSGRPASWWTRTWLLSRSRAVRISSAIWKRSSGMPPPGSTSSTSSRSAGTTSGSSTCSPARFCRASIAASERWPCPVPCREALPRLERAGGSDLGQVGGRSRRGRGRSPLCAPRG
jgi:G6PDH family F420-dependent oxidoreductase